MGKTAGEAGWRVSRYNLAARIPDSDKIAVANLFRGTCGAYTPIEMYLLDELESLDENHPMLARFKERGLIVNFDERSALEAKARMACGAGDSVGLTICPTMGCNFDCPYCFENHRPGRMSQETQDDVIALAERMMKASRAKKLDVTWFGGEPLLMPDIIEALSGRLIALAERQGAEYEASIITNGFLLTQEIADMLERCKVTHCQITLDGIVPCEIITNGVLIAPELLDELERQGHRPIWFVSFDGLGHHDWLRGVPGTEEKVLKNIRLLCDRGYYVHVHQFVWKDSLDSIRPTVLRMKELGVSRYRLITVEPSLRWRETVPEQTVSTEEWLEFLPDFLDWWYENDIDLDLDVWSYWTGSRGSRRVTIVPDLFSRGEDNSALSCPEYPNRFFIDADGRMVRCMPLSGGTAGLGIRCPNVYEGDDLQEVMMKSDFLTDMTCTCLELKRQNPECLACRWFDRCGMGCRAEALTQGLPDRVSLTGIDRRMCLFFNSGCYEKLKAMAEKHGLEYTA